MANIVVFVLLRHHILIVALTALIVIPCRPVLNVTQPMVDLSAVARILLYHLVIMQHYAILNHLIVLHHVAILRYDLRIWTLHRHLVSSGRH